MIGSQYVWPELGRHGAPGYSLKSLRPATERASSRLQRRAKELRIDGNDWLPTVVATLPADDPILMEYVAVDVIETARLADAIDDELDDEGRSLLLGECRGARAWTAASIRGIRVDEPLVEERIDEITRLCREGVEQWGVDLTRNTHDTRDWLSELGIRITDRDGKATLSHKWYDEAFVPDQCRSEWADFRRLRQAAADTSKLKEIRDRSRAGRIHPNIRTFGAVTGRMSVSSPALQNIPSRQRDLFMAEPGHTLIGCDLDRVEPCIAAALSGDQNLKRAVSRDVYVELAVSVWGETARDDRQSRTVAKTAFLAQLYGQGTRSLAQSLGVPERDAARVVQELQRHYPTLFAWIDGLRHDARRGTPLRTGYGRPLPPPDDAPYRAVNWVVQGTAADVFKDLTLATIDEFGPDVLWLPIHDELIIQVPDDYDPAESVACLQEAMTWELLGVPITGTAEMHGARWST